MKLLIRRSQRTGSFSSNVIFCLDARVEFTPDERQSVQRYRLQSQVLYNSEASQSALAKAEDAARSTGMGDWRYLGSVAKSLAYTALAAMRLNVTINSLQQGQHIECKSLDELLGAEEAIFEACKNLRAYLETAATFDGREVVVDFSTDEPEVIAQSVPQPVLAPVRVEPNTLDLPPPAPTPEPLPQYELIDGEAVPVRRSTPSKGAPAPDSWAVHQAAKPRTAGDDRFGYAEQDATAGGAGMIVAPIVPRKKRR